MHPDAAWKRARRRERSYVLFENVPAAGFEMGRKRCTRMQSATRAKLFQENIFCYRIASRLQNGPETLDTYAIRDPRNLFHINPVNDGISGFGVATKMPPECRGGIPGVQKIQFGQGIAAPNGFLEARAGGGKAHVQLSAEFLKDNEDPQGHAK